MERRQTGFVRQIMRITGLGPVLLLLLGLGLVLAGPGDSPAPAPATVADAAPLSGENALEKAANGPMVALPAGAVPMAGLWIVTGGLAWAGFGAMRATSALRAARRGEVREARVIAHARAGRRRGAPRRLAWRDARGQRGESRPRPEGALDHLPVGSVVVVYADPLTGRGWWEEDL